ncbi:hypothetical protein K435DRAFT_813435 [Dendrothele bispora CBS 962.96]|uniref:Uncharacterized protein n=1 Tax=Dendrothele bispora (strain CBS 962.96) TaxID=1314807 RepID=A0A4S8KLP7_DENBC|nr:hypothetical protein K435DRAFT_813435 [Dendrothele bispora CBS 962.96]
MIDEYIKNFPDTENCQNTFVTFELHKIFESLTSFYSQHYRTDGHQSSLVWRFKVDETCPSSEEAVNYFDVELFNALNFSFDTAIGDFNIDDFTMSLEGVNTEISQGAFDLAIDTASPAAGVDATTINSLPPPSPLPLGDIPVNNTENVTSEFTGSEKRSKWPGKWNTQDIIHGFILMDDLKGGPKKRKISREKAFGIAFPGVPYKASTFTKAYRTYIRENDAPF